MLALVAALALSAGPTASPAPGGRAFAVEVGASSLTYELVHKLHQVEGRSTRVEGKAIVQPDGKVLAMVRVPVATFDSGDGNRDAHMQEAVESGKFPFSVVKGVTTLPAGALDGQRPATLEVTLAGELELHGVKAPIKVPLQVTLEPGGAVRVKGFITVSLDTHGVERPSLLFVKVDDTCKIGLDLVLKEVKP